MPLVLNNLISSQSQISYKYITKEEGFGYTINGNYTVDVSDIQFTDDQGVLLTSIDALRDALNNTSIVANFGGDQYTNGRLQSLDFEESSLNGSLTARISVTEDRPLSSYANTEFASNIPNPHLIESFTEAYTFSRSEDQYSYSRDLSLTYSQQAGNFFIDNTKTFLAFYFTSKRPQLGYLSDGISENATFDKAFKGTITEEVDLINLSVSFNESFDSNVIDLGLNVSRQKKYSITQTEQGYTEKNYEINFTSLNRTNNTTLQNAVKAEVSAIVLAEGGSEPVSIAKGFTVDGRQASLSVGFSNDPSKKPQSLVFTCDKDYSKEETVYNLLVTYQSQTGLTQQEKYQNSITNWKNDAVLPLTYVQRLFAEATAVFEKARQASFDKTNSTVSQTTIFTTKNAFDTEELGEGITKYEIKGSSDNLYPTNEYRNNISFDLTEKKDFYVSNELRKLTKVNATAEISFSDSIKDTIMTTLRAESYSADLLAYAQTLTTDNTLYKDSDVISVNLKENTASRSTSYTACTNPTLLP